MGRNLNTKAIVKESTGRTIQHPLGDLKLQITKEDLQRNPGRHIRVFGNLYENRQQLEREINTTGVIIKKQGSENIVTQQKVKGKNIRYAILMGGPKKRKSKRK